MSAFGGKADIIQGVAECPLIARSGHFPNTNAMTVSVKNYGPCESACAAATLPLVLMGISGCQTTVSLDEAKQISGC